MKSYRFALAALLLVAAGATAGVPVIELAPSAPAQVQPVRGVAQLVGQSAPSAAAHGAALAKPDAGVLVAVRPRPSLAAVLLLVLGCLVYQGRRRRNGFALRPTHTLRERFVHAPALA